MRKIYCIVIVLLAISCSTSRKLPEKQYYQFTFPAKYSYQNDTLQVAIKNPLNCPLRISISSPDTSLFDITTRFGIITLKEKSDTTISYFLKGHQKVMLTFNSELGDVNKEIIKGKFSLPFPKNRSYKIIQGYYGWHSHNTDFSRYAIDFSLSIKDTVCAAADGYVVGVIKDYKYGGKTMDWVNYANYITIYQPASGLFTQYVHLMKNGSFVKVGDTITKGQPIGLSGETGYTNVPHLHFNVLKPDKMKGLISTEAEFEEGYKGKDLKENTTVKK